MFSLIKNNIKATKTKNKLKVYPKCENVLYFNSSCNSTEKFVIPVDTGIGAVLISNDKESWGYTRYIGNDFTPCEAEYYALIIGLEKALADNIMVLSVCGDNLLVINQINKITQIESKILINLYDKFINIKNKFQYIDFSYIKPEENFRARELSKLALNNININNINK
jgi:ribonuclease HI